MAKEDIRNICPDIGESTINRALKRLKADRKIEPTGKGRSARWRRILE